MTIKISALRSYTQDPEQEIKNITSSFSDHVKLTGKDTPYRPRLVFFDFFGEKSFGIVSRPYVDQTDYISSIAEMMYSYKSLEASACVLVLDSFLIKDGKNVGSCLYCYFIGDESAHIVCLPYSHQDDQVVWDLSAQSSESIDLKHHDGVTQQMIELLYVYSHISTPPFQFSDLLSYYSLMGYQFRSFKNLNVSYIDYSKTK